MGFFSSQETFTNLPILKIGLISGSVFNILLGALAVIRYNLLCRTSAQKDFHYTRAKGTGEAIGARAAGEPFLFWRIAHCNPIVVLVINT